LSCGTKFGKTVAAINEAIIFAATHNNATVWWIAPVFNQTKIGWRRIGRYIPRELVRSVNRVDLAVTLINNSQIVFKSADEPDHLRGEDVHLAVVDEAAVVKEDAWNVLQSTLIATQGKGVFISSPKGHNWFYRLWRQGFEPNQTEYKSFQFPTSINPYVTQEELEKLKKRMPAWVYDRDVLAQFKEDYGTAFNHTAIKNCISGVLETPKAHESYVLGADLGKHQDYAVTVAMNLAGHVCGFKRWQANWDLQIEDLKVQSRYWNNALIGIDSTGVGDPILDALISGGVAVEGYNINSNVRKTELIHNLMICLEQGKISFPDCEDTRFLIEELKSFGYKQTESGTIRYEAPSGLHDDCVIALALAAWFNQQSTPWDAIVAV